MRVRKLILFLFVCLFACGSLFAGESGKAGKAAALAGKLQSWWKMPAEDICRKWRLRWETSLANGGSPTYSAYCSSGQKILGVQVAQIKFDTEEGVLACAEFMFFNKGDLGIYFSDLEDKHERERFAEPQDDDGRKSRKTSKERRKARQEQARLEEKEKESQKQKEIKIREEWQNCEKQVRGALSQLGDPKRIPWGGGKLRHRADSWTASGTVFVLDVKENEYVRLVAVPEEKLEKFSSGTMTRVKSNFSRMKKLRKTAIGDVVIDTIPMVNQGAKGYCAPATVERVLLYYGVENIDMHEVSRLAETGAGGGTAVRVLIEKVGEVVRRNNLKFDDAEMSFSSIKRRIDRGTPLLWCLFAIPEYQERARVITEGRKNIKSIGEWRKKLDAMPPIKRLSTNAHMCLIIGYNAKTREVCVSDSWGEFARERWVRFDDALAVGYALNVLER